MEEITFSSELPMVQELAPENMEPEQDAAESYFESQDDRELRLSIDATHQISGLNKALE